MDRRTFLVGAAAAAVAPSPIVAGAIKETYANCPAGFALRSWAGDDGKSYRMVVRLPRYSASRPGVCLWTEQANSRET